MIDKPIEHEEGDDELSHLDPDDVLIVDYLARALSPADAAAAEERLRTDREFFEKAAPHIRIWTSRVRYGPRFGVVDPRGKAPAGVLPLNPPKPLRTRWARVGERVGVGVLVAAVLVFVVGVASLVYLRARSASAPPAVTVVPGPEGRGIVLPPPPAVTPTPKPPAPVVRPLLADTIKPADTVRAADTVKHVRLSPRVDTVPRDFRAIMGDTMVVTGPAESLFVAMENGTHVIVRPSTRFRWVHSVVPGIFTGTLEGEIAIDVAPALLAIRITTSIGSVNLRPGSFALRCELGCTELLLTVQSGNGSIIDPDRARNQTVEVQRAGSARLRAGGPPEKTDGGAEYPKPIPAGGTGRGSNH